ncbi:MAG: T9SS type A sorting domain-containing protein, partial [Flavobacteriales bacterium]
GPGCDFNELQITVVNDAVSTVTYEIREQGSNVLAANGTVNPPAGSYTLDICLPDGCYYLVVTDNGGDGIVGGGYLLSINDGPRIIDNSGNFTSGSTSSILNNGGFCVPLGTDGFTVTSCDKEWWVAPNILDCVVNPAVSAVWQSFPAGSTERGSTGYQVWWFDPNGGFSFRRFQSHNTPNGLAASPTRASRFVINEWAGNQLQEGVLYNVRVRSRVLGTYAEFGPTCRFRIDGQLAQCPPTQLVNIPGDIYYSCGVSRPINAPSSIRAFSRTGANRYQFEFSVPSEGILFTRNSTTNWIRLDLIGGNLLQNGTTYDVRVRVSKTNGATWCPFGEVCQVTIDNGSSSMTQFPEAAMVAAEAGRMTMFPNPNRGDQLFVNIEGIDATLQTVSVDIYDAFGKRVSARTIAVNGDGFLNATMQLNGELAAGLYTVSIAAGEQLFNERLVVQP